MIVSVTSQAVRPEGLGRRRRFQRRKSHAVRRAGKRIRDEDSVEEFVTDNHVFTGGLALGIEAEMIFGGNVCRCQSEVPPAPIVAWRNGDAHEAKNHCSEKPDGAAAL